MNYKKILEQFGLKEGVDFVITSTGFDKIAKTRIVDQVIHHDAVPARMNGETVIESALPAYDETIQATETYFEVFPSTEEILNAHKNICIKEIDIAILIEEYLKDKSALRDTENDSINIVNGQIQDWRFTNIPCPTRDELFDFVAVVELKNSKEAIQKEIAELEASITPRRVREAVISGDNSFIVSIDNQIAVLRAKI
jgi:hypothetical protein